MTINFHLLNDSWNPKIIKRPGRQYEIIYTIKASGLSGHYIKINCHNTIEKDNCSQQVLKFVTIKTEQSRESEQALVRRTFQFLFAESRLLVFPLIG